MLGRRLDGLAEARIGLTPERQILVDQAGVEVEVDPAVGEQAVVGLVAGDRTLGRFVPQPGDRRVVEALARQRPLHEDHLLALRHVVEPAARLRLDRGIGLLDLQAAPVRHLGELAEHLDRAELDQVAHRRMHALGPVEGDVEEHAVAADLAAGVPALLVRVTEIELWADMPGLNLAGDQIADVHVERDHRHHLVEIEAEAEFRPGDRGAARVRRSRPRRAG